MAGSSIRAPTIQAATFHKTVSQRFDAFGPQFNLSRFDHVFTAVPRVSFRHAHKNTVMEVKWNLNGNWLLTASRDHLCKLFDIRNLKEELQVFRGHKKEATGREMRCFLHTRVHEHIHSVLGLAVI